MIMPLNVVVKIVPRAIFSFLALRMGCFFRFFEADLVEVVCLSRGFGWASRELALLARRKVRQRRYVYCMWEGFGGKYTTIGRIAFFDAVLWLPR